MSVEVVGQDLALLRLPQVLERVGIKKTKVYALIKEGIFPAPRNRYGVSLWLNTEINEFIRQTVAGPQDPFAHLDDDMRDLL